jgi:hypothetical protein
MKKLPALFAALIVCAVPTGSLASTQAQDPCAEGNLPAGVATLLAKRFPAWKVEKPDDFDAYYRKLWLKAHPNECPGIAIGHFFSDRHLSFAVLLISRASEMSGYKLVTIVEGAGGSYQARVLEGVDKSPPTPVVLEAVPPGQYSDAEGGTRARITLDAIQAEQLEAGAILYYWRGGRFRRLITSE